MPDLFDDDLYVDGNGCPTERVCLGGQEVIVHYDDIPETDITTVDGIRVTTPLRTVIDIATEVDADHLGRIIHDCVERQLFTLDEALARLAAEDMVSHRGAALFREALSEGS
jgi:hypothetical protein